MNLILALLIPLIFILSFLYAALKKIKIYDSFAEGVKGAIPLIVSIFPYVATVTILLKVLEVSGLETKITAWISPLFSFTGIPQEIASLIMIKPLSGSGSIAVITQILERYGVDSYAGRCACVAYGASDTIFYIGAIYFANIERKRLTSALLISLVSYLLAVIFCCFLCRIM